MGIFNARKSGEEQGRERGSQSDGRYAIEFRDVHKAFGGNRVFAVGMAISKARITIMGPLRPGKCVCLSHMGGSHAPRLG